MQVINFIRKFVDARRNEIAERKAQRELMIELKRSVKQARLAAIANAEASLTYLDYLTVEYREADAQYRESLRGASEIEAFKCWLRYRAADARFFKQVLVAHEANYFLKRWKPEAARHNHLVTA